MEYSQHFSIPPTYGATGPLKHLSFIPTDITNDGTLFDNVCMMSYHPVLPIAPNDAHSEYHFLPMLYSFCNFDILNTIPTTFNTQTNYAWTRTMLLINPPFHLNTVIIENIIEPRSWAGQKILRNMDRAYLTCTDLILQPGIGLGCVQGIIKQDGPMVQVLITFRNRNDAEGMVTFVAVWLHYSRILASETARFEIMISYNPLDKSSESIRFDDFVFSQNSYEFQRYYPGTLAAPHHSTHLS